MLYSVLNLAVFVVLLVVLFRQQKSEKSLSVRVFTGLGLGVLFGAILQFIYGVGSAPITDTLEYVNIVGSGYVSLLKMIIMPLILVSIIGAIVKVKDTGSLGKMSGSIIGILLATTAVSALIGVFVSSICVIDVCVPVKLNSAIGLIFMFFGKGCCCAIMVFILAMKINCNHISNGITSAANGTWLVIWACVGGADAHK